MIAILSILPIYAQNSFFQRIGVELWDGVTIPLNSSNNSSIKPSMSLGAIFKYSFDKQPWDFGLFFQMDNAKRKLIDINILNHRTTSIGIIGSYNFLKFQKVSPFIGLGMGAGYNFIKEKGDLYYHNWAYVFIPKCGIELYQWLRFSIYCQLSRKSYNTIGISLGVTLGGKKTLNNNSISHYCSQ